jgi:hypothetical protein
MARSLYLDVESARFISGFNSSIPASLESFFQGDNAQYELYFVQRNTVENPSTLYEPVDYSARTVKLAIGAAPPSTATAYVAQNTWANLGSTVTATVARTVTGSATTNEQQLVTFTPAAWSGTFALTIPARSISVSSITAGLFTTSGNHGLASYEPFVLTGFSTPTGFSNGQTLFVASILSSTTFYANATPTATAVTAYTASGSGTLSTVLASTSLINARASGAEVRAAMEGVTSVGIGNVSVVASPGSSYKLAFTGEKSVTELAVATVAGTSLIPVYGKTATLNFATIELNDAISGSATLSAVLEVETTDGATIETTCQVPVTLSNDIIAAGSLVPITAGITSFTLLDSNSEAWVITIDTDGILTATKA